MEYGKYIVYLIKCAILGQTPENVPENLDLNKLYRLAKAHNVDVLVYCALKQVFDAEKLKEFEQSMQLALALDTNQNYYLEEVSEAFEENKIRFAVMKGFVIKPLYPSPEQRHSVDIDIFVDDENTDRVKEIMEELGFSVERFNHNIQDDSYSIGRFVHIEIHRTLISNKCSWDKACQKITQRLKVTDGYKYRSEMTLEDFYLYMIGHMAKHMKYSGMGIKMVVDVWVYLNKYRDLIDKALLDERLREAGLSEFNDNVLKLVGYWFSDKPADDNIKNLSAYVISSGNYGTYKQLISTEIGENSGTQGGRTAYYLRTVFIPYRLMCSKYGFLEKLPFLLPFMWVYRAVTAVLFRRKNVEAIKSRHDNVDAEYAKQIVDFKKSIGIQ